MNVIIIGSGNVADVLGRKIKQSGHQILEVVGRNKQEVSKLAQQLDSRPVFDINIVSTLADIYIIAVSDMAIKAVADELRVPDKIVVHTAASQPIDILAECSIHYGVIYPLQTLKKDTETISPITILINGEDESTIETLEEFCSRWAEKVTTATDEDRQRLHIAAVFVNNFTNHLFAVAKKYCTDNALDFKLLLPLAAETFSKIKKANQAQIQTGPARRGDEETIKKHLKLLDQYPAAQELYQQLTESIISFYKNENE